jgi:hypothetical protein
MTDVGRALLEWSVCLGDPLVERSAHVRDELAVSVTSPPTLERFERWGASLNVAFLEARQWRQLALD